MTTTLLTEPFRDLPDPRSRHGMRYPLDALITISISAAICGAEDWVAVEAFGRAKEDWFRTFLDLPDEMPSHDTFGRLFERLDPDAFEKCFRRWTASLAGELRGTVALDGKTLRRSFDAAAGKAALHMVSLWAGEHGLVFGQQAVDEKSNELTAIPIPTDPDGQSYRIKVALLAAAPERKRPPLERTSLPLERNRAARGRFLFRACASSPPASAPPTPARASTFCARAPPVPARVAAAPAAASARLQETF